MTTFMLPCSLVLEWVYALNVTTCKIIVIIVCLTCWMWQLVTTLMLSLCLVLQWIYNYAECTRSRHSWCHYQFFCVDVWAECKTSHHSWCHYHFFFFFIDLNILFTGTKISCTSSPVSEGETASVTCHFNSNLRETRNNFFVYRTFKTDGKRRHGNTLHTNFFSTCKTILKISTMPVYS